MLRTLWLDSNSLTEIRPAMFSGLTALQTLRLHRNFLVTIFDGMRRGRRRGASRGVGKERGREQGGLQTLILHRNFLVTIFDGMRRGRRRGGSRGVGKERGREQGGCRHSYCRGTFWSQFLTV